MWQSPEWMTQWFYCFASHSLTHMPMVSSSCGHFFSYITKEQSASEPLKLLSLPGVSRLSHSPIPVIMSLWKLHLVWPQQIMRALEWMAGAQALRYKYVPGVSCRKQHVEKSWDFYQWTLRAKVSSGALKLTGPYSFVPVTLMMKLTYIDLDVRNLLLFHGC